MQQLAIDLYGPTRTRRPVPEVGAGLYGPTSGRPSESPSPHRKARATDLSTSRRAALEAYPRAGSQRERILAAIVESPAGMNYDEASEATGIVGVSVSTRISELSRGGWIVQAGERETRAHGMATVWIASTKALGRVAA